MRLQVVQSLIRIAPLESLKNFLMLHHGLPSSIVLRTIHLHGLHDDLPEPEMEVSKEANSRELHDKLMEFEIRACARFEIHRPCLLLEEKAVVLMDCGAYGGEQVFLTTMTAHTLGGNYRLGAVRLVSRAVYTNTAPNGAFRACNGVYNTFALERHTDE